MKRAGICATVEKYLQENGEKTYAEILQAMTELDFSQSSVSGSLATLRRMRRISHDNAARGGKYSIRKWTQESATGLRKYIPEFKPKKGSDMFASWNLCTRAPYDPARDDVRLVR
jgi:hypothetical protein